MVTLIDAAESTVTEFKRRAEEEKLRHRHGNGDLPPYVPPRPFGPGDDDDDDKAEPLRAIDNSVLGMMLFLGTDAMFFAALIGAFLVFRVGATDWPPVGQPTLPVLVTGINTMILLISGVTMLIAWRRIRYGDSRGLIAALTITAALGTIFLLIQGFEWVRLIGFGLTLSSGVYGATFYTLIGTHALHVVGAVVWLAVVMFMAYRGRFSESRYTAVKLSGMYWLLVVLLWPVLYVLVYFN